MGNEKTTGQPPAPHNARQRSGWREKFVVEERHVPAATRRRLYTTSVILGATGLIVFFVMLFGVLGHTGFQHFDQPVNEWFMARRQPAITGVMIFLTIVFGPIAMPIIVFIVVVTWLILAKHAWRPLLLAAAMSVGMVIAMTLLPVVGHPRPPVDLMLLQADTSFSFPSGHVVGAADFLLVLAYLIASRQRRFLVTLLLFAVAIAGTLAQVASRLYLGYHWISDTTASIGIALVVLGAVIAVDTARTAGIPDEQVRATHSQRQVDGT